MSLSSTAESCVLYPEASAEREGSSEYVAECEVGGMRHVLQTLRELVVWPFVYSEEAEILGLRWPRGILLHGPPGTGKNLVVKAIAKESKAHFQYVSSTDIFGAYSGESERKLRKIFSDAKKNLKQDRPSIIFIDEIDALCPPRDSRHQHESRIVAQLLTLMDGIDNYDDNDENIENGDDDSEQGNSGQNGIKIQKTNSRVIVIAATNRPNSIDPALRRPGRFDREISFTLPNIEERKDILTLLTKNFPLEKNFDMDLLASKCQGYVGADLASLCREAATSAISRFSSNSSSEFHSKITSLALNNADSKLSSASSTYQEDAMSTCVDSTMNSFPAIGMAEFEDAMTKIRPTMTRGLVTEVPRVTWDDIGGLDHVKKRLQQAIEWPIKHASSFKRLGLKPPRGILLHGPPGCSKTTMARAVANSSQASLISLSGADVFSMYVGEGEKFLRDVFRRARLASPTIIFFDEVDTVATKRSDADGMSRGKKHGGSVSERILACLLTEIDGLESSKGVMILAATNRPQVVDPALLRPGRFDLVLYIPPPDEAGRKKALEIHTKGIKLSADVDFNALAKCTELFTGADLANLCREATLTALREDMSTSEVAQRHFMHARSVVHASLTPPTLAEYAQFEKDAKLRSRGR